MLPDGPILGSLAELLAVCRPCFTSPTFRTFLGLVVGLIAQTRRRTVCGMVWIDSASQPSAPIVRYRPVVERCAGIGVHRFGAFGSDAADEPFGVAVGVRGGILTVSMPSEANTASIDAPYWVSRSRLWNRNAEIRSSRSAMRLRAACVVHAIVGCSVASP